MEVNGLEMRAVEILVHVAMQRLCGGFHPETLNTT